MNEAELRQVATLVDAGKLVTVRWSKETAEHGLIGYGSVSTATGDPRFVVHRQRHKPRGAPSRLLQSFAMDYEETLANAKGSAGMGSGVGGYPFLLAVARAMLEAAPSVDHSSWRDVVRRFEEVDAARRATR